MTTICMHYFISGTVQGVWFRASTQEEAGKLNITGWVKNMYDGRVEIIACGEPDAIEALEKWLAQGPPGSHVENIEKKPAPEQHFVGFEIIH